MKRGVIKDYPNRAWPGGKITYAKAGETLSTCDADGDVKQVFTVKPRCETNHGIWFCIPDAMALPNHHQINLYFRLTTRDHHIVRICLEHGAEEALPWETDVNRQEDWNVSTPLPEMKSPEMSTMPQDSTKNTNAEHSESQDTSEPKRPMSIEEIGQSPQDSQNYAVLHEKENPKPPPGGTITFAKVGGEVFAL
jgi:hypothetical protein